MKKYVEIRWSETEATEFCNRGGISERSTLHLKSRSGPIELGWITRGIPHGQKPGEWAVVAEGYRRDLIGNAALEEDAKALLEKHFGAVTP